MYELSAQLKRIICKRSHWYVTPPSLRGNVIIECPLTGVYALNNTQYVYQESDFLGPLHSSRKKSKVEIWFEIKFFYSLFGNFFCIVYPIDILIYLFFLKKSTNFWRKYLEICNFLIIYQEISITSSNW